MVEIPNDHFDCLWIIVRKAQEAIISGGLECSQLVEWLLVWGPVEHKQTLEFGSRNLAAKYLDLGHTMALCTRYSVSRLAMVKSENSGS